jgi:ferredoxin--NADP+ reductase
MTGPYGRHFLPPRDNTCNLLMIGVGTGIAPFRAFLKHIYEDRREWQGQIRLFYGARTGMDLLYLNDKNGDLANYYDEETFKAFQALSPRPHFDEPADMQATIADNAAEAWELMQDPKTHVYISGLAKLEEDLDKVFSVAAGTPEVWETVKAELAEDGRWSTLYYG